MLTVDDLMNDSNLQLRHKVLCPFSQTQTLLPVCILQNDYYMLYEYREE